jgi:hypothetical protein
MFGIRKSAGPAGSDSWRPASSRAPRTHSAIPSEPLIPVDLIPPAQTYLCSGCLELIVAVLGRRAEPDVGGGHLVPDQAGNDALPGLHQPRKARAGRRAVRLVLDVVGRRAEQDVPVDGRRDEDALRLLRRDREEDVVDQASGELVEDDQLPAPRGHPEVRVVEHRVDLVAP